MYSFNWLCGVMRHRKVVTLCGSEGTYSGLVNGIAPEDGSGQNWLVTLALTGGGVKTIFVKAD